jgi:hypothetical protein
MMKRGARVVGRIIVFDLKGMVSLVLWAARRRHGVPPGATELSYSGAQTATMLAFLSAMVVELVGVDIMLRGIGAPSALRGAFLLIDGYSILIVLAVIAACITRPHVVSADELRIRYGAFFDLRVPLSLVTSVRAVRNLDEHGKIRVDGDRLAVAVASQTLLTIELAEPVWATRPLGARVQVRTIRIFVDDPEAALAAFTELSPHSVRAAPYA